MLNGTMQETPLLVSGVLKHAAGTHGDREIVSRLIDEPVWRYDWSGCEARAGRLANALVEFGIRPGDRVTTLAWNTHRHMEIMYAVPGMGAVLHTANPRLADEQIIYTINHAGGRILFFDQNLASLVARISPQLKTIEYYVVLQEAQETSASNALDISYEALIEGHESRYDWPEFDENSGAIICYTSGTTGNPKGVLYSHRSIVLHALAAGLSGAMNLSAFDVILPGSSLYHANGWGIPFAAAINGCKVVLPADKLDGESLHELIVGEGVTMSAGVPTVWTMYLAHLEAIGEDVGDLRRIMIGGSALPRAMAVSFKQRGVEAVHALGMTETSPLIVVATPTPKLVSDEQTDTEEVLMTRQGRSMFGIEIRIVDEDGIPLPWDGASPGSLMVRGPWVVDHYFPDVPAADADGWFDTGDIATIDAFGFLRITDRKKDVIKSGGEWVSSIDLENAAIGYPGIRVAAVIGVYHPKWEERPLMIIEPHDGVEIDLDALREFLASQVAKWWLPDDIIIAPIPLTATGKVDKKPLRETYRNHLTTKI